MRFADLFRRAPSPHVGDTAIHETADGKTFGKVVRSRGVATTIQWETGVSSIHRIIPGGEIAVIPQNMRVA